MSACPSTPAGWSIIGLLALAIVIAGTLVLQQSGYLRAGLGGVDELAETTAPAAELVAVPETDAPPIDPYTQREADCQSLKAAHITECGMGYPEDDFNCRTHEAEEVFQTCLATTPTPIPEAAL